MNSWANSCIPKCGEGIIVVKIPHAHMLQCQHNFYVHIVPWTMFTCKSELNLEKTTVKFVVTCTHALILLRLVYGSEIFLSTKMLWAFIYCSCIRTLVGLMVCLLVWSLIKISCNRQNRRSSRREKIIVSFNTLWTVVCHGIFQVISLFQFAAGFMIMIFIRKSLNHFTFSVIMLIMMMMMTACDLNMDNEKWQFNYKNSNFVGVRGWGKKCAGTELINTHTHTFTLITIQSIYWIKIVFTCMLKIDRQNYQYW